MRGPFPENPSGPRSTAGILLPASTFTKKAKTYAVFLRLSTLGNPDTWQSMPPNAITVRKFLAIREAPVWLAVALPGDLAHLDGSKPSEAISPTTKQRPPAKL